MYAMEYSKQERAAPAAIAIVANLILVYALAVSIGVVPSPARPPGEGTLVDIKPKTEPAIKETIVEPGDAPNKAIPKITLTEPVIDIEQPEGAPTGSNDGPVKIVDGGKAVDETFMGARLLRSAEPEYPMIARVREEEGTVFVKVMISPYGVPGDMQIEKSSGYSRLDEAALKAVRGWRFAPAKRGSQAIATWVTVPVKFVLNTRG